MEELSSKTDNNVGDVWKCLEDNNNYCWNKEEWVNIGTDIDLSTYATKEELESKADKEELNQLQDNMEAVSVPAGGTTGQILEKKSNEDNDVGWVDNIGGVTGDTLPIGSVVEFASDNNVPANWLLCNGQEVSRTEYALLFAVIGTTWGEGDGSTTFNVPTKEGLITVGKKESDSDFNALGKTGGEKTHFLTVEEMPEHNHPMAINNGTETGTNIPYQYSYDKRYYQGNDIMGFEGGNQPHNNLQPYVTSNFIIKAKQSAGLVATVVDSLESDSPTDALSAKQGKVLNKKIDSLHPDLVPNGPAVKLGYKRNGKDVYGKLFKTTLTVNGGTDVATLAHGISNYDEIWVDKGESYMQSGTYRMTFPCIYYHTPTKDSVDVQIMGDNIRFISDTSWAETWTKFIMVKYTKA